MTQAGTQHQFGYQWNIFREIQNPVLKEQFRRWIQPLDLEFFKGKSFIDAGCGAGRNSYWAMEAGASRALAFDYDERTVEAARQNLAAFPRCEVALRSIYDFTVSEPYDIAFSVGVVHHLAEPRRAVENLVRALKPGGTLILWVYAHEGNERYLRFVNPVRNSVTSRIPLGVTRWIARGLVPPLKAYLWLPHRKEYLKLLRGMSFRRLENIVFDQLLPTIANYWTRAEVLQLVEGLPLRNIRMTHTNGMSWSLVAEKT